MTDPIEIVKRAHAAYVEDDRAALEAVIGEPFAFTSPLDNRLDRKTYFERCWPNHDVITGFDFVRFVRDGERVIVTYEATFKSGRRARNTNVQIVRDGRIVEVEVYFGWNLPHDAPPGGFVNSPASSA